MFLCVSKGNKSLYVCPLIFVKGKIKDKPEMNEMARLGGLSENGVGKE